MFRRLPVEQLESRTLLAADFSGAVWSDHNLNSQQDAGERIPNVAVYLDTNFNRVFDPGEASAVSDSSGAYAFTGLGTGYFPVRLVNEGFGIYQTWNAPSGEIQVGAGDNIESAIVDHRRQIIYYMSAGAVQRHDLVTSQPMSPIPITNIIDKGLDLSLDGKYLLIGGRTTTSHLTILDLDNNTTRRAVIATGGFQTVDAVAATSRGTALVMLSSRKLLEINLQTLAITDRGTPMPSSSSPAYYARRSANGTVVLFHGVGPNSGPYLRYDVTTNTSLSRTVTAPEFYPAVSVSRDGSRMAFDEGDNVVIRDWNLNLITTLSNVNEPRFSETADLMIVSETTGFALATYDTSTWQRINPGPDAGVKNHPTVSALNFTGNDPGLHIDLKLINSVSFEGFYLRSLTGVPGPRLRDGVSKTGIDVQIWHDIPITLHPDSDTGTPGDLLTRLDNSASDRRLRLNVTNVVNGSHVELYTTGGVLVGSADATSSTVTIDARDDLVFGNGTHSLTAKMTAPSGVAVPASKPVLLKIDTDVPTGTVNALTTYDRNPSLSGTTSESANSVKVTIAGVEYLAVVNGASWSIPDNTIGPLDPASHTVTITIEDVAGNVGTSNSFEAVTILEATGVISGQVYSDVDRDGPNSIGLPDAGLADWTVYLDLNRNGSLDPLEPTTNTGVDGIYTFTALTPGKYRVGAVKPAGWLVTSPTMLTQTIVPNVGASLTDSPRNGIADSFHPDASLLQQIDASSIENRVVREFDATGFTAATLTRAQVGFVLNVDSAGGQSPRPFSVHLYAGDGVVTLSDFTRITNNVATATLSSTSSGLSFILTNAVKNLLATGATWIGMIVDPSGSNIFPTTLQSATLSLESSGIPGVHEVSVSDGQKVTSKDFGFFEIPPFDVQSTTPAHGGRTNADTVTVGFTWTLNNNSITPGEATIDGLPANPIAFLSGTGVRFSRGVLAEGPHHFELGAGTVMDELGRVNPEPVIVDFVVDKTPPRIVYSSIANGGRLSAGPVAITVRFSEDVQLPDPFKARLTLLTGAQTKMFANSVTYNSETFTATFNFNNVLVGSYSFALAGDIRGIMDHASNVVDGEATWPMPVTGTGNGVAGGDFLLDLTITPPLPDWLEAGSAAEWNASTSTLTLTGQATINTDPAVFSDNPIIVLDNNDELLIDTGAGGARTISLHELNFTGNARLEFATASISYVLVVGILSINSNAYLDLNGNDMIVKSSTVSAIEAMVASGFNFFGWDGPGIRSTASLSDPNNLTTLGILDAATYAAINGNLFRGQLVSDTDVLVKYTYYGDADLSGVVDGTDYALIDTGFANQLSGWFNGDFDHSGTVDGTDYALIDTVYVNQVLPMGYSFGINSGLNSWIRGFELDDIDEVLAKENEASERLPLGV